MTEQPIDKKKLAQEKRDLARRARSLAQLQAEPDNARLTQLAAELDQEAEALERWLLRPRFRLLLRQCSKCSSNRVKPQLSLSCRSETIRRLGCNHPAHHAGGFRSLVRRSILATVCGTSASRYARNK